MNKIIIKKNSQILNYFSNLKLTVKEGGYQDKCN